MMKIFTHIKQWNKWRKRYKSGIGHKLLVLLKLRTDITFDWVLTKKEEKEIINTMKNIKQK